MSWGKIRVPGFPGSPFIKVLHFRGLGRIPIMSEIGQYAAVLQCDCVALRPLSFEREDSDAADIQADADLHTLSTHHRDAVHDMRRADAAYIDRAARPELQSADLSLRALQFRRELSKGDVSRRHFGGTGFPRAKKARPKTARPKTSGRSSTRCCQPIRWRAPPTDGGKPRPLKPATQSEMPQPAPAH